LGVTDGNGSDTSRRVRFIDSAAVTHANVTAPESPCPFAVRFLQVEKGLDTLRNVSAKRIGRLGSPDIDAA
jgi:hypothetical protein